jgi:hypothetical protein
MININLLPVADLQQQFQGRVFLVGYGLFLVLAAASYSPRKYDPEYIRHIGPQMAVSFGLALRKVEVQ